MEKVVLTEEMIEEAYKADTSLQALINNMGVLNMFAGATFVRGERGGWRGDGGYYAESSALGRVLEFASSQSDPETVQA